MGEPFDDRCFTNACFSNENGIIFAAAAKDENESFDFISSPNDRIHFPFSAKLGQILSIGAERWHFICNARGASILRRSLAIWRRRGGSRGNRRELESGCF